MFARIRRPWAQHRRGQTLVEFALILPILILLLVGIFDLGRAVYALSTVNNAAREAVRLAIVNQDCDAIGQVAKQHASSLSVDWSYDGTLTPGAACYAGSEDVHIQFLQSNYSGDDSAAPQDFSDSCDPGQAPGPMWGCVAKVTVEYHYTAATPIIGNLVGQLTLRGESEQPVEFTNP